MSAAVLRAWLTRFGRPLDEVVPSSETDQLLFDDGDLDNCESGYCLT